MQPVVKYKAKKETQVTNNKFFKIYSDIKKMQLTETKFHDLAMKKVFKFHDIFMHGILLGQIPGKWEPCHCTRMKGLKLIL